MKGFKNPLDPDNLNIKTALRRWAIEKLALAENAEVQITEIQCAEPNCVHVETLISVVDTEGGRFFKINKPLVFIRKWDVQAWQEMGHQDAIHRH
jgi:hypothetical protein